MAPVPEPAPAGLVAVLSAQLRRVAREARRTGGRRLAQEGLAIDRAWVLRRVRPPPPPAPPPLPDPLEGLIVEACNMIFRVTADHARLRSDEPEVGAAIARIGVNLQQFGRALRRGKIDSQDLAGRRFDPNSREFEPRAHAPMPGVTVPTISECFRPLVIREGRIVQAAVGVVATPPLGDPESSV